MVAINYILAAFLVLFQPAVSCALDIDRELEKASDFLETGKPDSAAVLLNNLFESITEKRDRAGALYYFSQAMRQLGYLSEEIHYLLLAREESSGTEFSDEINLAYARILLKTGNFNDCITIAEEFRLRNGNSPLLPEMLYIAGEAYLLMNEYRRAFNIFNEISEQHQNSPVGIESVMKEGICLYYIELIGGAIDKFEWYLYKESYSENIPQALHYLGLCYENLNQPEHAVDAFQKLLINYPSYPRYMECYFKLGKNLFDTRRFIEAKNIFLNYAANTDESLDTHNEALLYLERMTHKRGGASSEIDIYEAFTRKNPDNPLTPKILFDLLRYYTVSSKIDKAYEKFSSLIAHSQNSSYADSAAFLLADTYFTHNRRVEAQSILKVAASIKADSLRTQKRLYQTGTLYEKWEFNEAAISSYERSYVLKVSSDISVLSLMGIGRILKKMDRWLDSGKIYERILKEFPDNTHIKKVYLSLADIYYLEGRLRDAAAAAEKAVKYAPEREKTDILLYIAEIYEGIDYRHSLQLYSIISKDNSNTTVQKSAALLRFGDLALRTGNRESAVLAYQTLISNETDSTIVNKAREKLNSLIEQ